ncbi:MAG: VOC family protein [Candidatus Tectomicrobia bacterium]|uniref:VOC family protein n=1 Tax=Tectimicrobiota bacterium TaxID=2528274 RepID=A0A932HZR0_UNCTE|nr:VOC family protein [Candidatus Tectomicrobia bacterium]
MRLDGIHHLALAQGDIRRAEDFYTRVLGGEVVRRIGAETGDQTLARTPQVWVRLGGVTFALNGAPPEPPRGHFVHYALKGRIEDLDAWAEAFKREGVPHSGPYGHGGTSSLSLYFHDPAGYLFEIGMDAGTWERAKEEVRKRGGLFGNPEATYDIEAWERENLRK